jgi:hypothetical protein
MAAAASVTRSSPVAAAPLPPAAVHFSVSFAVREPEPADLKLCTLATRTLLHKTPFSPIHCDQTLLEFLCSWYGKNVDPFLHALKAGEKPIKTLVNEHLTDIDPNAKFLLECTPDLLHCKVGAIIRIGLPQAEPQLIDLLKRIQFPFGAGQTIFDAVSDFYYYNFDQSGGGNYREIQQALACFLVHQPFERGNVPPVLGELLSLLSNKKSLASLTSDLLPAETKGLLKTFSFEEELALFMKCALFASGSNHFQRTAKLWNEVLQASNPIIGRLDKAGEKGLKNLPPEMQNFAKIARKIRTLAAQIHVATRVAELRLLSVEKILKMNSHDNAIRMMKNNLQWSIKALEEHGSKLEEIHSAFASIGNNDGLRAFQNSSEGAALLLSLAKASLKAADRLLAQVAPQESTTAFLEDLETDDSSPAPSPEPIAQASVAAATAPEKEPDPAPLPLKREISIPSEDVVALNRLIEDPSLPLDGAFSQSIANVRMGNDEIDNHLLLATQSFELFCDLFKYGRIDLLAACVQGYLLDCHVAVEQHFGSGGQGHSLVQAGGRHQLDEQDQAFLKTHDLALLWTRYLAHFSQRREPPAPVQWLKSLTNNPTPQNAHQALLGLIGSYEGLLRIFKISNPRIQTVLNHLKKMPPPASTPSLRPLPLVQEIRAKTETAVHVRSIPDGDPVEHMQEICHFLEWIRQGSEIQQIFKHPKWSFWHLRVKMNADKLFKHLFAADCLLLDYGTTLSHHLTTYINVLQDERIKPSHITLLQSINLGLTHHYMDKLRPDHAKTLKPLLAKSKESLSIPEGFQSPTKRKNSDEDLHANFDKALALFEQYLPGTLQRLQEKEELRRRDATSRPLV